MKHRVYRIVTCITIKENLFLLRLVFVLLTLFKMERDFSLIQDKPIFFYTGDKAGLLCGTN